MASSTLLRSASTSPLALQSHQHSFDFSARSPHQIKVRFPSDFCSWIPSYSLCFFFVDDAQRSLIFYFSFTRTQSLGKYNYHLDVLGSDWLNESCLKFKSFYFFHKGSSTEQRFNLLFFCSLLVFGIWCLLLVFCE